MSKPLPEGFQEWWDSYKSRIPTAKRASFKKHSLIGWIAHEGYIQFTEEQDIEFMKSINEEYNKAGQPEGWYGDPS